jgi:hypothetical protein
MKKHLFTLTMAFAVTVERFAAKAATFGYNFTGGDGVVATGTLTGSPSATVPGAFQITSGTIDLAGAVASLDGNGVLVPNTETGVFLTVAAGKGAIMAGRMGPAA